MSAPHPETQPEAPRPEAPDGFSLALNLLPFAWLAGGVAVALAAGALWPWAALGWLYLAAPLAGRLVLLLCGRPGGEFTQDQRGYRVWWVLTQLQVPYNRLPALEELLRLVPALYPAWIALWGGRLSARSYVSPGVVITDRWLVSVGAKVVLGYRAVLLGHYVTRGEDGRWRLVLAMPVVGDGALIGGEAGVGPGAVVASGAVLPAGRRLPPFARFPREGAP